MDIRIVAEDAKIGFVFARRGIVPEACSSYILPRIVGISKASELVYTGRVFLSKEEPSLFNYIVPSSQVLEKALSIAKEIALCAPSSVTLSKALMWSPTGSPMEAHLLESKLLHWCFSQSPDAKEGVLSFLEKRDPKWGVSPWSGLLSMYPWWSQPVETQSVAKLIQHYMDFYRPI